MVRIKQLRTERNMTQRAVADIIQSSQKAVDVWEKGISEPTSHFVVALADCFGCSTDYLLERTDETGGFSVRSEEERRLLERFRAIGEAGKKKLLETAETLS